MNKILNKYFIINLILLTPIMAMDPGTITFRKIKEFPNEASSIAFLNQGSKILTTGNKQIKIWDINGNEISGLNTGIDDIYLSEITSDNNFAIGGKNPIIELWDLEASKCITSDELDSKPMAMTEFNQPNLLFIGTENRSTYIWDPRQKGFVNKWPGAIDGWTFDARSIPKDVKNPQGKRILVTSHLMNVYWWGDTTGCATEIQHLQPSQYWQILVDDNNDIYIPQGDDNRIRKFNKYGEKLGHFQAKSESLTLNMLNDKKHLVSGHKTGAIYIWDASKPKYQERCKNSDATQPITNLVNIGSNYILASDGFWDNKTGYLRLLDATQINDFSLPQVAVSDALESPATGIVVTSGNTFSTISYDGTLIFWKIDGLTNQQSKFKNSKFNIKNKEMLKKLKDIKQTQFLLPTRDSKELEDKNSKHHSYTINDYAQSCDLQ